MLTFITWKQEFQTLPASVTDTSIKSLSNAGGALLLLKERKVHWKEWCYLPLFVGGKHVDSDRENNNEISYNVPCAFLNLCVKSQSLVKNLLYPASLSVGASFHNTENANILGIIVDFTCSGTFHCRWRLLSVPFQTLLPHRRPRRSGQPEPRAKRHQEILWGPNEERLERMLMQIKITFENGYASIESGLFHNSPNAPHATPVSLILLEDVRPSRIVTRQDVSEDNLTHRFQIMFLYFLPLGLTL